MSASEGSVHRSAEDANEMSAGRRAGAAVQVDTGSPGRSVLDTLLERRVHAPISGVLTGRLIGFLDGKPLVTHSGGGNAVIARSTVDLAATHIGQEVILAFDDGRADLPVILGQLRGGRLPDEIHQARDAVERAVEVDVDGRELLITASEQLVLRCGDASITMTKAGKVLIQGRYVSSLSCGVNRIKGGSVQIN